MRKKKERERERERETLVSNLQREFFSYVRRINHIVTEAYSKTNSYCHIIFNFCIFTIQNQRSKKLKYETWCRLYQIY